MLQSAQQVAIDLTRNSLQTSDFSVNNVGSSEPDGAFAALLQVPPPGDGEANLEQSGSDLPAVGSELPTVASDEQPATDDRRADIAQADFIAYYEGDDDPSLPLSTADQFASSAAGDPAEVATSAGLTGIAPPASAATAGDPRFDAVDRDARDTPLRTDRDGSMTRRDHGRLPFAQPLAAPDRMIFNATGHDRELMTGKELTGALAGREAMLAEAAKASIDRQDAGMRMPGQLVSEQGSRVSGEALATFELPVQKDGIENAVRPAGTVTTVAAAGHMPDLTQIRDLAGTTKPAPVLATTIGQPVVDEAWGEAFQDRILWMAKGRIQNAEIRLNPAELGPIRVQVTVEDDAAMLQFTAQHNTTREAIEQALPRLREMLSENGLTLAESSINDAGTNREDDHENGAASGSPENADSAVADADVAEQVSARRIDSSSLIDTFV